MANKPPLASQVADDQGYANIGYHNSTMLTPRIDELAHEGVILESYCALAAPPSPAAAPPPRATSLTNHGAQTSSPSAVRLGAP